MIRLLPYLLAATLVGGGVWYVISLRATVAAQGAEIASLARSNAALTTQNAQSAVAREVDAARATLETKQARDATAAVEAILTAELGGCADAPLDPVITDILNGLHGRRN
jgi:hypothetical protein